MKRTITLWVGCLTVTACSTFMPDDQIRKTPDIGWQCDPGYYPAGRKCVPIAAPEHAVFDDSPQGWSCDIGFYQAGRRCIIIPIPENASPTSAPLEY